MAMDAAVKDVKGKVDDKDAVLKALKAANFASIKGSFKYGNNQFPIQDYYLRVIEKNKDGVLTNKTLSTPLKGYRDAYYTQCKM
jgi:branched-chain amino acid transport system substrate-binding protein